MSGNLNMNTRSIITLKEAHAHESTYAANTYVNQMMSDSNTNLQSTSMTD